MATVRVYVISRGPYRDMYAPQNAVVVLRSSASDIHPCAQWTPLAQELFSNDATDAVYVIDFADLLGELPAEIASPSLGPILKPLQRCFMKVNPQETVLVAAATTTALAGKLLRNDQVAKAVKALVFLSPQAPLGKAAQPLPHDVQLLFPSTSAAAASQGQLTAAFTNASEHIIEAGNMHAVMGSIARAVQSQLPPALARSNHPRREEEDLLRFSELLFSMDIHSRQMTQKVVDITSKVPV
eukprot:GGOE01018493.1.p1 GENE.GGOE01018493.1~~GGOE01018493.1.p1  ORF type:complete len:241 (-),score=79.71 GGOE01018493.1:192-914(-)